MEIERAGLVVLIKGAGEVASGIAHRVYQNHYRLCLTEIPYPQAVSRGTAFSEAIFDGTKIISGVTAELTSLSIQSVEESWQKSNIPIIIDPESTIRTLLHPDVIIDARMLKVPTDTRITDAMLVIGIGPGFVASKDVHIVIETNERQGNLGKLIYQGETEKNSGIPIDVGGLNNERVVWSPEEGIFTSKMRIGDPVEAGQVIAKVNNIPLTVPIRGNLRSLLRDGMRVAKGAKIIEVDRINDVSSFYVIREKMSKIGEVAVSAIRQHFTLSE